MVYVVVFLLAGPACSQGEKSEKDVRYSFIPNTLEGLPGGFLTFLVAHPTEIPARTVLPKEHEVYKQFQLEADNLYSQLTYKKKPLPEWKEEAPDARKKWDLAVSKIFVTRSRPNGEKGFLIVAQSDIVPVLNYLDEVSSKEEGK